MGGRRSPQFHHTHDAAGRATAKPKNLGEGAAGGIGPTRPASGAASVGVVSEDGADASDGFSLADAVVGGDVGGGGADGLVLDHFQGDALFGGLDAEAGGAEDEDGAVDGDGRFHFRHALVGQPGVLLLEEALELAGELVVVEFAGPVAAEVAVESLGQARQHDVHQLTAHDDPRSLRVRAGRGRLPYSHCRASRRRKQKSFFAMALPASGLGRERAGRNGRSCVSYQPEARARGDDQPSLALRAGTAAAPLPLQCRAACPKKQVPPRTADGKPIMIQVDRLTKYFGNVLAVSNVSFQVEKNEIVGLLGNNGAGKTTIMRILTTYLPASSGVARVSGFDVMKDSMEVRRRIGYLPENIPLYGEMRVEEYLDFRAKIKGVERRRRRERVDHCVERCRLEGVRRALLGTLSKGFRQRVGLADALIADPPLLILDEPTDGLDPGQKQETLAALRDLGRDHTIMLSSHLLTEVESIVQRVIILKRGHLGLAKKLSELEIDSVIVVETRGPADQVVNALRGVEGVTQVTIHPLGDGLHSYDVRTRRSEDLREQISRVTASHNWPLRRLDLRRRNLQDRWNDINNLDESTLPGASAPAPAAAVNPPASTAVTQ